MVSRLLSLSMAIALVPWALRAAAQEPSAVDSLTAAQEPAAVDTLSAAQELAPAGHAVRC